MTERKCWNTSSEKSGTSWLASGFQLGIGPGLFAGIIPVFFVYGWGSNVWVFFLAFAVNLLIPAIIVLGDRHNRRGGQPLFEKAELNSLLIGVLLGAIITATVVTLEFFVIHGPLIVGALLWIGYRTTRWVRGLF